MKDFMNDPINHPSHYTSSEAKCTMCGAGIECIQVTEHMGFNLGNAVKYAWRCDLKSDAIQDLRKAIWYINREIIRREHIIATNTIIADELRAIGKDCPECINGI